MDLTTTRKVLDELASRAILVDMERGAEPPIPCLRPWPDFRVLDDAPARRYRSKGAGELFYQYMNVEEEFIRQLFVGGQTQLGRAFVHETSLSTENALHVLDYERASQVIETASHRGVGMCYCRHKMLHVGRNCDAPMDICMTFNGTAQSLTKHGYAREVDVSEGMDLLQQAHEQNLVQFGENVREGVNFICNCCGCVARP